LDHGFQPLKPPVSRRAVFVFWPMKIVFPVLWRKMWRSITIFISVAIIVPLSLMLGISVLRVGYEKAFRHVTPPGILIFILGVIAVAAISSLLCSLLFQCMKVTLGDDFIQGRNFWGMKRKIPLGEITRLSAFYSHGVECVVVSSARHGEIYISMHTENLNELLMLLGTYLPKEKSPPAKGILQEELNKD
jgi:hypothetical protein